MADAKKIRREVGMSRRVAARLGSTTPATLALYEADPDSVGPIKRARLDALYTDLGALLAKHPAA